MAHTKTIYQLKKAITDAKKCFVWTVIGCTPEGTPIGGFIEAYKSHLKDLMKTYVLPHGKYDTAVKCYFRTDENGVLYIEGFHVG